eukprot:s2422_g5.t1
MVAEPLPGAMMLPWRLRCSMAPWLLMALAWRAADVEKEHFMKMGGRSLNYHTCNEKQMRDGSRGMTGTLGRCDLGGNRTSRWIGTASPDGIGLADSWSAGDLGIASCGGGTETLVQVQDGDGALVRVQSRAADVAGTAISAGEAISACGGGMAFRTCAGLRRSSCWNAISACVEISACEGMALETEMDFGPVMRSSWSSSSWTTPKEFAEGAQWNLTARHGGDEGGLAFWNRPRPIYELDTNATKEIQYELMRNLRWWSTLSSLTSWSSSGFDMMDKYVADHPLCGELRGL